MNYDYLVSTIQIGVPDFKELQTDSSTIYFTIEITAGDHKWFLEKKYPQFQILAKELKNYHSVPALPGKNFFFRMTHQDQQNRRKGLQQFLRKLVVRDDLMNNQKVKEFLQLDKNAMELMMNPPQLMFQYEISGAYKGINDFKYDKKTSTFYLVTGDTNALSKMNAKVSNTKLPWENEHVKTFIQVGTVEAWVAGDQSDKFMHIWSKNYPKQALCLGFSQQSSKLVVGLEDGTVDVLQLSQNKYEDLVNVKIHQDALGGVSYDHKQNVVYSVSEDKVFRVSHGSSLAAVYTLPHRQNLKGMLHDQVNDRIFFGTKYGQIYIYGVKEPTKPNLLTTFRSNDQGSIKSFHLDLGRNYLFCSGFETGEINVFDIDHPGRERYAKLNATLKGKEGSIGICWSSKRKQIITGTTDGTITFWNALKGKPLYVQKASKKEITRLQFWDEKQLLVSSSRDKSLRLWALPMEWKDSLIVEEQNKLAGRRVVDHNREKVQKAVMMAQEDSDDDDLAFWHLD